MSTPSLQGQTIEPQTLDELAETIRLAFDYRGDVAITLKNDTQTEGYLYGFIPQTNLVRVFVKIDDKTSESKQFSASQIQRIAFTGQDHAFGKSWEDIQRKKAEQASSL